MKTINISALLILFLLTINTKAQESTSAAENSAESIIINGSFGMGTFAAGENVGGSVFLGGSLSADWIPIERQVFHTDLNRAYLAGKRRAILYMAFRQFFVLAGTPVLLKMKKLTFLFW